jgi:hypothetical protein
MQRGVIFKNYTHHEMRIMDDVVRDIGQSLTNESIQNQTGAGARRRNLPLRALHQVAIAKAVAHVRALPGSRFTLLLQVIMRKPEQITLSRRR